MKPSFKTFLNCSLVLTALFISACAQTKEEATDYQDPVYSFHNKTELEKAVSNFAVNCEGACPESAGVLIIKGQNSFSTCSFSLIGPDLILTNRHCIPDSLATPGAACDQNIKAIFMGSAGKEVYSCKEVVSLKTDAIKKPGQELDYAFLRLEKTPPRKSLSISTTGVQNGDVVTALTATPFTFNGTNGSKLIAKSCQVHMNSLVNNSFTNGFKPVMAFKNCDIVGGNSGSAVVNAQGQVVGVIQANFSKTENIKNSALSDLVDTLTTGKFAAGSNILCLENRELGLPHSACDLEKDTYSIKDQAEKMGILLTQQITEEQNRVNALSPIIRFKTDVRTNDAGVTEMSLLPECVKGSAKNLPWLESLKPKGFAGWFTSYPETTDFKIAAHRYGIALKVNSDARMELVNTKSVQTLDFTIPVKDIVNGKAESYMIEAKHDFLGQQMILPWLLKMCGN